MLGLIYCHRVFKYGDLRLTIGIYFSCVSFLLLPYSVCLFSFSSWFKALSKLAKRCGHYGFLK